MITLINIARFCMFQILWQHFFSLSVQQSYSIQSYQSDIKISVLKVTRLVSSVWVFLKIIVSQHETVTSRFNSENIFSQNLELAESLKEYLLSRSVYLFIQCLWCETDARRCLQYPPGQPLPTSVCNLSSARWGVCWGTQQAIKEAYQTSAKSKIYY